MTYCLIDFNQTLVTVITKKHTNNQ